MKSEKGFIVTEMLVSIIIMAIIALGAGVSITQIYRITRQNNDWSTAVQQAQNAGYWISHDALMSVAITGDNLTAENQAVNMVWSEWETGSIRTVQYTLMTSPDGLYRIKRMNSVYGPTGISVTEAIIANHIKSIEWSKAGTSWQFTVNAISSSKSATREYFVSSRVSPE